MKKQISQVFIILLTITTFGFLSSCDDDKDDLKAKQEMIVGTWKISSISTDNDQLNSLLPMLPTMGIQIMNSTFLFGEDGTSLFNITLTATDKIEVPAKYNFDGKQLAFALDVLPIPFNAFDVPSITEKNVQLNTQIPASILGIAMEAITKKQPELAAKLQQVLGTSLENGLNITLNLNKE